MTPAATLLRQEVGGPFPQHPWVSSSLVFSPTENKHEGKELLSVPHILVRNCDSVIISQGYLRFQAYLSGEWNGFVLCVGEFWHQRTVGEAVLYIGALRSLRSHTS